MQYAGTRDLTRATRFKCHDLCGNVSDIGPGDPDTVHVDGTLRHVHFPVNVI